LILKLGPSILATPRSPAIALIATKSLALLQLQTLITSGNYAQPGSRRFSVAPKFASPVIMQIQSGAR
jgi:hypothetical protein